MPVSKTKVRKNVAMADGKKVTFDLLDMLPVQAALMDREGRIVHSNGPKGRGMGSEEGELIFDQLHPSSIEGVLNALRDVRAGRPTEVQVKDLEGRGLALHLRAMGKGSKGEVMGILLPSERCGDGFDLGAMVSAMGVPAQVIGPDLTVHLSNERVAEEIGWVAGKKGPHKKEAERRRQFLKECLVSGQGGEREFVIEDRGRTTRYLDIVSVIESRDGRSLLEIWIDVTPGSGASPEAGKGEIFDEMIETSNALVIGLDKEGSVQLYNRGAQRALGYPKEAVLGRPWFDFLADPGTGRGALDVFQWNINTGFRTRFENRIRSSSGDPVTVSWENTVIFDGRGNVRTILMIGQDITQMKRLEESLVMRSEELGREMEEAGIYNDLMLHDIHNSTAAIMGYLELMALKGLSADKRQEYGARALSEVKKSAAIIKEVRALSRISAAPDARAIQLGSSFPRLHERAKEISKAGTALRIDMTDLKVLADDHLDEAMVRLVEHVLRTMKVPPSRIEVQAKRAPQYSKRINQPVLITVTAPGLRIGEEEGESMFRTVPRKGETSDRLGMYLVRRVVDRYGGAVWVDRAGTDAAFHVLIRETV